MILIVRRSRQSEVSHSFGALHCAPRNLGWLAKHAATLFRLQAVDVGDQVGHSLLHLALVALADARE
jgi:hypothetical protein